MELSLFLAKLFGLHLLIIAVLLAVRREAISRTVEEFFESRPLVFLSGLIALAVGLAMVIGHNVWEWNWRGLVTLFGYLSVAKGVVRIGFPDLPRKAVGGCLAGSAGWIWIAVSLLLGGYLTWAGFTQG